MINAAQEIKLGEADVVLTGGAENMSLSPCEWRRLTKIKVCTALTITPPAFCRHPFWRFAVWQQVWG